MTTISMNGHSGDQRSQLLVDLRNALVLAERLLDELGRDETAPAASSAVEALSERELDVLRLLARGSSNKQVASALGIAENTVKTHVSTILGKLGVESRTQAALYAKRFGLVGTT